jgi:tRNA nucleotidyltransferase (CCA-adding enzyme)
MPDYIYMLESRLSAEQRAAVVRMQELGVGTGSNIYLTGGAVRDLLAGMFVRDLDFSVEGNPQRLARELEKGGARILSENEKLRQVELIFSGDVDGSISAARDDVYARPGTKPEIRWSTIMEDLRQRDFSINAIAISLNPASRGLLLDPTNGLADLEKGEIRALSIHSFTNQPVRLLRAIRYGARMGYKIESRTEEWISLALERKLHENISGEDAGQELRQLAREEKPTAILKAWEARGLVGSFHPQLARRHPDYESLARILRARDDLMAAGLRPRLLVPVTYAVLGRLKAGERAAALHRLGYRSQEVEAVLHLEGEAKKIVKALTGRKTAAPGDAFAFLTDAPADLLAFLLAETSNSKALAKIRNYLQKWRPLRQALPAAVVELETLGYPRGPKFDKAIEEFFRLQLAGKGRTPEDRIKILRKLSGIKEPPKKIEEKEKKKAPEKFKKTAVGKGGAPAATAAESAAAKPAPAHAADTRPAAAPAVASAKKTAPRKPVAVAKAGAMKKSAAGKKQR